MKKDLSVIFQIISPDNTISVNRVLCHSVGLNAAVLYSSLLSKHAYFSARDMLDNDGSFFSTLEQIEADTALSPYQQRAAIAILTENGLISVQSKGMPARRFFTINDDVQKLLNVLEIGHTKITKNEAKDDCSSDVKKLNNKMSRNLTTGCEETSQQDIEKLNNMASKNLTPGCEETSHNNLKQKSINRISLNQSIDLTDEELASEILIIAEENPLNTITNDEALDIAIAFKKAAKNTKISNRRLYLKRCVDNYIANKAKNEGSFNTDEFWNAALKHTLKKLGLDDELDDD